LEYLHNRSIAYLDLKSENVMLNHDGYIKLIDFGVAEKVKNGRLHGVKGSPLWMAPEMLQLSNSDGQLGYTTAADLWSLGVNLHDWMLGGFPYGDSNMKDLKVMKLVKKAKSHPVQLPKSTEDVTRDFIGGLLTVDPSKRLGAGMDGYEEIKDHPFWDDFEFSWDKLLGRQLTPPFVPGKGILQDVKDAKEVTKGGVREDDLPEEDGWQDPEPSWTSHF